MEKTLSAQTPVIKARDLYKCYPGFPPVLRGVNIDVMPGEMVAIMGPSGCGKSTMLHVLGMLHAPDAGSLEILGENVLALNREGTAAFRRGNMGFVMQASNLFDHSTVFENVEFPLIYENVPPQERWGRVIRALDLVRLSARVHYRSNRLSGGEQQRVAIARAMVNNPRILLADEPTGALDARTSRVVMENFRHLCHDGGVAMVMVTHDPKMAEFCDSIYTLEDGVLKCQKHEPPLLSPTSNANFLEPPKPKVVGALVARHFPDNAKPTVLELSRLMHAQGLLARIYALATPGLLSGQDSYSLPLAVRHIHWYQRLTLFFRCFTSSRPTLSDVWRALGSGGFRRLISSFGNSLKLGQWVEMDGIAFLYACDGRQGATATWIAAKRTHLPFAFAIAPEDLSRKGGGLAAVARDASFITCSTPAIREALFRLAPDVSRDKALICPNMPIYAVSDDEGEASMPPQPGMPTEILVMGSRCGQKYLQVLFGAARLLIRRGLNFRITILGKRTLALRFRLIAMRLRKLVRFSGIGDDRLSEAFRLADIFVVAPPLGKGEDLTMPPELTDAMASSLPIVALGISPGMDFALHNEKSRLLVTDSGEMAEALGQLISRPELRIEFGRAAKREIVRLLEDYDTGAILAEHMVRAVAQWKN